MTTSGRCHQNTPRRGSDMVICDDPAGTVPKVPHTARSRKLSLKRKKGQIGPDAKCSTCGHPISSHTSGLFGSECFGREKIGDWWENQTTTKCTCTEYSPTRNGVLTEAK
jgi:hypothetical protein